MAQRLRVVLVGFAVAVSASLADTDIPSQLHDLREARVQAPVEPSESIQTNLMDRFKSSTTTTAWSGLSPQLQRALLWEAGLVRAGTGSELASSVSSPSSASSSGAGASATASTYIQVYVPCGYTMNDAFLAYPTVERQANAMNCSIAQCNKNSHYTFSTCLVDALENITRCGVDQKTLLSLPQYDYTSWSQDGIIDTRYDPVVLRKRASGRNASDPRRRLIPIDMATIVESTDAKFQDSAPCPSKAGFVVPCRALDFSNPSTKAEWCTPNQQLGVKLWVTATAASNTSGSTPAAADATNSSGSSWSLNALAVTLLVALVVAAVFGIALFVLMWRQQSASHASTSAMPSPTYHNGLYTPQQPSSGQQPTASGDLSSGTMSGSTAQEIELANETFRKNSTVLAQFCADQALMIKRIAYSRIRLLKPIDKGANGEVWKAHHDGKVVAVKRVRLHESASNDEVDLKTLEEFTREIRLASMLDHPNIVGFVGLSWRVLSDLCMVSEYMPMGDLARHLESNEGRQMKWGDEKVLIAIDVANALVYLHSLLPQVIHRDLKSRNVLLDEQLTAKLSDFGLSRERSPEETMTSGVGTMLWTAPEVLRGERYDEKADVYSFGVLLVELDTCLPPFSLNSELGKIRSKAMALMPMITRGEIHPKFSPQCPVPILELATQCLDLDVTARPTAMQVVYHLRSKIRPLL